MDSTARGVVRLLLMFFVSKQDRAAEKQRSPQIIMASMRVTGLFPCTSRKCPNLSTRWFLATNWQRAHLLSFDFGPESIWTSLQFEHKWRQIMCARKTPCNLDVVSLSLVAKIGCFSTCFIQKRHIQKSPILAMTQDEIWPRYRCKKVQPLTKSAGGLCAPAHTVDDHIQKMPTSHNSKTKSENNDWKLNLFWCYTLSRVPFWMSVRSLICTFVLPLGKHQTLLWYVHTYAASRIKITASEPNFSAMSSKNGASNGTIHIRSYVALYVFAYCVHGRGHLKRVNWWR